MGLLFRGVVWFGLYVVLAIAPLVAGVVADPFQVPRPVAVEELVEDLEQAPDLNARIAELETFLVSHGRANVEQDRDILEYLARQR